MVIGNDKFKKSILYVQIYFYKFHGLANWYSRKKNVLPSFGMK